MTIRYEEGYYSYSKTNTHNITRNTLKNIEVFTCIVKLLNHAIDVDTIHICSGNIVPNL